MAAAAFRAFARILTRVTPRLTKSAVRPSLVVARKFTPIVRQGISHPGAAARSVLYPHARQGARLTSRVGGRTAKPTRALAARAIARNQRTVSRLTRSSVSSRFSRSTARSGAAAASRSRPTKTFGQRLLTIPRGMKRWASKHKGALTVTGLSIGVPLGVTASMQQSSEAKAEKFNNEYLKIMKTQNDHLNQQQQQQQLPSALQPPMSIPPPPYYYNQYQPQYESTAVGQQRGYHYNPFEYYHPTVQHERAGVTTSAIYNPFDNLYGKLPQYEDENVDDDESEYKQSIGSTRKKITQTRKNKKNKTKRRKQVKEQ